MTTHTNPHGGQLGDWMGRLAGVPHVFPHTLETHRLAEVSQRMPFTVAESLDRTMRLGTLEALELAQRLVTAVRGC